MDAEFIKGISGNDVHYVIDGIIYTLLMDHIIYDRQEDIVKLLKSGCDINETNERLTTALMMAARRNNIPVIKILLKHDASRDLKNINGKTFMDLLAMNNKQIIIEYIEDLDSVILKPAKYK